MPGKYPYTGPRGDDIPICDTCGQRHATHWSTQACSGHVLYDRANYVPGQQRPRLEQPRPCEVAPMYGQDVCYRHGGGAPNNRAAGERRIVESRQRAEIEQLMVTLGEPVDDGRDYAEVIAERVAQRRGHVAWLHGKVLELDPDALAWGRTKTTRGDVVVGTGPQAQLETAATDTDEAKPSIWYVLYEEAAAKLEKLCLEAIRVGVEVRRLQIDERTADRMVTMIDGIVAALGHDPNAPETAEIVARHLELVA